MSESEIILHCPECASGRIVKTINSCEPDGYHCLDCKQELFESVEYSYITAFEKLQKENQELKLKLDKSERQRDLAVEGLWYYANPCNWERAEGSDNYYIIDSTIPMDDLDTCDGLTKSGGKRARQAIREIKEERKCQE